MTGRARTATGSKYTPPGMPMRTLESSLCRSRLVKDVISPVLPSYRKREYFALLCLDNILIDLIFSYLDKNVS